MTTATLTHCPTCGTHLGGLARYCFGCSAYVADMLGSTTDSTPPNRAEIQDTRLEDQRKADALPTITALGWTVLDFEQGYRPDNCPECKAHLPGGHSTRVPIGTADQFVMGHGLGCWLEWKTDDNDQTVGQKSFQLDCEDAGFPYAVVRNTADAVEFLQGLRRGT